MGSLVFQATLGGQVNLNGPNTASTFDIAVPATTGTMVTTGDSGTVTNTMLAASAYNTPGTIGSGTANSGAFTTLSASSTVSGAGFSTYLASPPAIGGTAAAAGSFTTLAASSTVSGTGFSTYLASPPAIGGTAAAAGTFTTLSGTTSVTTPIVKSASSLSLQTNGTTTAVTVDTSQRVGIGTTSPAANLEVAGASGQNIYVTYNSGSQLRLKSDSGDSGVGTTGATPLLFLVSNGEKARIDTSGNVGIGTSSPSASAILDAQSTTKGVRMPNMTTTQKNAISSPAAGLMVFDTTLSKLCVYSGSAWQTITSV
jgi:hypothetical protein